MKYLMGNPIFSLIICVMMVAGSKPILSSYFDVTTSTTPGGTAIQSTAPDSSTPSLTSTTGLTTTQTLPPGPTNTQTQTYTPGPTSTSTPTTTLMPLPAVTLIFPFVTETLTPAKEPNSTIPAGTPDAASMADDEKIPPRFRILSIVLIFLWLLLVGYLVVFLKHFR